MICLRCNGSGSCRDLGETFSKKCYACKGTGKEIKKKKVNDMPDLRKTTKETILECPACGADNSVPPGSDCAGSLECPCGQVSGYLINEDGKPAERLTHEPTLNICQHGQFPPYNRCKKCHPLLPDELETKGGGDYGKLWMKRFTDYAMFAVSWLAVLVADMFRHRWAEQWGEWSSDAIFGTLVAIAAVIWCGHCFWIRLRGGKD